jgi:cytidylate kinase
MNGADPKGAGDMESFADMARRILDGQARLGATRLVCIDGPAGSGKTTFANGLAAELGSPVVHMDDLYDGWDGAFDPDLPLRIDAWLMTPWRNGIAGQHPIFDWASGRYTHWRQVACAPVVIIEGVGAGRRDVRVNATEVIWIEAERSVRQARLVQRDGESLRDNLEKFMHREQELFEQDDIRGSSTLIVDGNSFPDVAADQYRRVT